jgi:hypothetical protein
MRAVPGAQFKFDFNPNCGFGQFPAEKAYPGDEYVDYIGVDVYDQPWLPETYPIPADATAKEIIKRQKKVWNDLLRGNHGVMCRAGANARCPPFVESNSFPRPDRMNAISSLSLQVIARRFSNLCFLKGLRTGAGYPQVWSSGLARARIESRRSCNSFVRVNTVC